ncbi:hypothetical protein J4Q44_G00036740 [Coregonus suidteri]|uniref:SRCR domain-containing protein n=1 Tax=Coregonus suidteri TaxID=861788 RepID=A0AAN8MCP1_9TELE
MQVLQAPVSCCCCPLGVGCGYWKWSYCGLSPKISRLNVSVHQVESVQLVDGAGLCSGRLEVKSNQSWASVCEADFDQQDAEVVCGELGCGAPAALQGGLYGEGEGQTWDKEFQCKGNESLLLDCDTSDRKKTTPAYLGNAVGLTCSDLLVQPDIFLTDSMGGISRGHQGPEVFRGYKLHHHLLHSASHSTQEAPSSSRSPAPTEPDPASCQSLCCLPLPCCR